MSDRIRRYRHPVPTDRRVREIAMLALTGPRQGLHVSLTRLVAFKKPDEALRHRHRVVSLIDTTYIVGSRPGRTLDAVLGDGVRAYAKGGFADAWERHHQGGLTGYAGREIFATPSAGHALEAGQCLAWNPSITGTKSQDTVLVTDNGFEILSSTGAWPTVEVEVAGQVIRRPDILQR